MKKTMATLLALAILGTNCAHFAREPTDAELRARFGPKIPREDRSFCWKFFHPKVIEGKSRWLQIAYWLGPGH